MTSFPCVHCERKTCEVCGRRDCSTSGALCNCCEVFMCRKCIINLECPTCKKPHCKRCVFGHVGDVCWDGIFNDEGVRQCPICGENDDTDGCEYCGQDMCEECLKTAGKLAHATNCPGIPAEN